MSRKQNYRLFLPHTPRETTYGAGVAAGSIDQWYELEKPLFLTENWEWVDDRNVMKGYDGVGGYKELTRLTGADATLELWLNGDILPLLLASMWGNCTTTGSTTYQHVIKQPGQTVTAPWTFSAIESMGTEYGTDWGQFDGIAVKDIEITATRGEMSMIRAGLIHRGEQANPVPSPMPTIRTTTHLSARHLSVLTFGPQDAAVDILASGILRSVTIRQSADLQPIHLVGGQSIGRIDRGGNPTWEVELELEGQKYDAIWLNYENNDAMEFSMTWVSSVSPSRYIKFEANTCYIRNAPKLDYADGYISTVTFPLDLHYDTGDSSAFVWTISNGIAAYLA